MAEPSQAARASGEEKKEEREAMGSPAPKETSEGKKRGHEADDDALVFKKPRTPEENFELMARCTKELITATKVIKDMLEVIQGQDDIGEAITSAANATRKELEGLIHGIAATEKGIAYYASTTFGHMVMRMDEMFKDIVGIHEVQVVLASHQPLLLEEFKKLNQHEHAAAVRPESASSSRPEYGYPPQQPQNGVRSAFLVAGETMSTWAMRLRYCHCAALPVTARLPLQGRFLPVTEGVTRYLVVSFGLSRKTIGPLLNCFQAWPGLLEQSEEDGLAGRVDAISKESCLELLVSQPRSIADYTVKLLWEQDGLVAVNKPYDMRIDLPKDGSRRWEEELTVADWFQTRFPGQKVRFCHQLDHATSGVLLMAANKAAGRVGSQLFEKRQVQKTYLALVLGQPSWDGEVCLSDRLCDSEGFARRVALEGEAGEEAETLAEVVRFGLWPKGASPSRLPKLPAALVQLKLITGRRHQIRLHLAAAGFPVLGDDTYGGNPWSDRAGSYRMFLHSHRLVLPLDDACIEAPCSFEEELEEPES
ncbi:unnamed protein product [Cladocopium goreaui]|uniref:RNA pseudouridylate synthase domain-containing protein 1 (Ribosomal large subunit pseudouridine synthase C-like protein) n=1 Tax=Cladocopium goreaui TaxID=2562237 RepID=A0A9P1FQD5_9DINO|nr:unnamed protein product [Cladocopium goreaui]